MSELVYVFHANQGSSPDAAEEFVDSWEDDFVDAVWEQHKAFPLSNKFECNGYKFYVMESTGNKLTVAVEDYGILTIVND